MGGVYTAPPPKVVKPRRKQKFSPWLLALLPAFVFIYLSTRPVKRLRSKPPAEFFDTTVDRNAKQHQAETQLAQAYWERAVRLVPQKYTFGERLPDDPPPEFSVEEKDFPGMGSESIRAGRARCWRRLHKVWDLPEAWEKSYEWSTDWITTALISFRERAGNVAANVLRNFRT